MKHSVTIGWLYPELMSTYGDRGNILVLTKRLQWRGIEAQIEMLDVRFSTTHLESCDLLFMGGAQDKQQEIVSKDLSQEKVKSLKNLIEDNTPTLLICGAYQLLGNYYKEADGTIIEGLGILDLYTENPGSGNRLIGDIAVDCQQTFGEPSILIGFENHGGRTYIGKKLKPLGKVMRGFGNNGKDHTEGALFNNTIGSYLHGPILPKNPAIADFLISKALLRKYKKEMPLSPIPELPDTNARNTIAKRLGLDYNTSMKLDVSHIAKLANLTLSKEETAKFEKQLEETLTFINHLNEVKTDGVEITYQVTGLENVSREDIPTTSLTQKQALSNAPKKDKGFFVVKGTLDDLS